MTKIYNQKSERPSFQNYLLITRPCFCPKKVREIVVLSIKIENIVDNLDRYLSYAIN